MIMRHVETLFCDDIRHEVGGKLTFIGVYSGVLFVPAFPLTLSKLCLSVRIVLPADTSFRVLRLSVIRDDEVLQEIALDEEPSEAQRKEPIQVTQFMLVFSPIRFDHPCTLRVRVQTEDGELHGLPLQIDSTPSPVNGDPK